MAKSNQSKANKDDGASAMAAAMMAVSPAVTRAWLEMMSDSARFLAERLQQDLETQKAMLACKTPTEFLQVQSEFFKTAMEQPHQDRVTVPNPRHPVHEHRTRGERG